MPRAATGWTRTRSCSCTRPRLFYGVSSTELGNGTIQTEGPEAGLGSPRRARRSEVLAYCDDILFRRFSATGRVSFHGGNTYRTDGSSHFVTSSVSGETIRVEVRSRVVDATYLSPTIPATTPPPFGCAGDTAVVSINELADLDETPSDYVIVGSGKTATDGIVWLLNNAVPPERIIWIRPSDPWMLNRAVVQPDPISVSPRGRFAPNWTTPPSRGSRTNFAAPTPEPILHA